MKNASIIVLCLFYLNISYSQEYLSMLDDDHVWNTFEVGCPDPCTMIYHEYYVDGEYVINGETYTLISSGSHGCYLRQDGPLIYTNDSSGTNEVLAFDFSMEVGDIYTFPLEACFMAPDPWVTEMIVVNKTTQMIAGEMRRVIEFEDTIGAGEPLDTWIEGIGSLYTAFSPGGTNSIDSSSSLTCFTENGSTYYFNGFTICFQLGIDDHATESIVFTPNPIEDSSLLRLPMVFNIDKVLIYDVSARIISEIKVESEVITINSSEYSSGMYFYQAISENSVIKTDRFVIR